MSAIIIYNELVPVSYTGSNAVWLNYRVMYLPDVHPTEATRALVKHMGYKTETLKSCEPKKVKYDVVATACKSADITHVDLPAESCKKSEERHRAQVATDLHHTSSIPANVMHNSLQMSCIIARTASVCRCQVYPPNLKALRKHFLALCYCWINTSATK